MLHTYFYTHRIFKHPKWNHLLKQQRLVCESREMVKDYISSPSHIHSTNIWNVKHPLCARPSLWEHMSDEAQWYGWTGTCHMGSKSKVFPGGRDSGYRGQKAIKEVQVEERRAPGRIKDK